ncbi:hypothetical protein [Clostridium baratii]|uniref:hypothetical protein n=1 Tax=Clostridium baratii TaxID=1561 RepID=UPI002913E963|nr:hypothetical protein [Clostridium baratii]MDU4910588.1 hypothetical protein [Clostridium baratii]
MSNLECTRCHYKLKGTENYCPRCGLSLKETTAQEAEVQEQSNSLHKLNIIDEDVVKLDDFQLKGITKYNLCKSSDTGISKLDLTIIVDNSKTIF